MSQRTSLRRRLTSVVAVVAVTMAGMGMSVFATSSAAAAPSPIESRTDDMVTADALPTVQVNGVVWSQAIVGNTVYAGGGFSQARPAGAAAGTNQTPRSNLLAYNIATGNLITSFAPVVNGQILSVAASPDGTRLYIAGEFTSVNGVTRNRVAAFNTATGALVTTFNPNIGSRVKSVVATNSTVYVGGMFTAANGQPRTRLAAYQASNGALTAWAPTADYTVNALTLTPDNSKVIVGGAFQNINGQPAYGLAAVDAATGALQDWAANQTVRNAGTSAAILSLTTDGSAIYGTGYVFGSGGNLEGAFSADPTTGAINWVEDCHGDTYGVYANDAAVYTVSHAHYCGNVGGFPQTDPWSTNMRFAIAFSKDATGTITRDPLGYFNWEGKPSPSIINWFPELKPGTYTGQGQAGWNITGNSDYIVIGGEFPTVNGVGQQGLVRMAVKPIAPSKRGPVLTGAKFVPSVVSLAAGTARVAFQTNWDQDDQSLTYRVVRNSNLAQPVFTTTADSTFWNRPTLGFTDTGLTPGVEYRYRLYVTDAAGNQVAGDTVYYTVPTDGTAPSAFSELVKAQGAATFWRLGETSGSSAYDWAGYNDGVVSSGVSRGAEGAVIGDANTASNFDGTGNGIVSSPVAATASDTFTTSTWIKTTTTSGGKILGFGNQQTGNSGSYDRHVYMDNSGRIFFGVYPGGVRTLNTTKSYNDGQWHQIVTSLGPDGMSLYVDGLRVATRSDTTAGQAYTGYWRVGGDNIGGWPSQPSSSYFAGTIDEVAIYPTVLTKDQVLEQYVASGRVSPIPAAPADTYGATVYGDQPDLFWRLADTTGTAAADASPSLNPGSYVGGVTKDVPGVLAGNSAVTFDGSSGFVASSNSFTNPTQYTAEAWFSTTTDRGGKIIGFGNSNTGTSNNYDRHVYMQNDGKLVFGTYTGQTNTVTTTDAYNNGQWHHVVASQGADGMKLYVDGQLVGTNPQTAAQNYTGYWKVGGDPTWGSSSAYFAGTIDEAAVYPTVLGADTVLEHFLAGGGQLPNAAPLAAFTSSGTHLTADFDASTSTDADGTVASYAWDFGDGVTGTEAAASHTYVAAGTYQVTLTVTDDKGATGSVTQPVTVTQPPANAAPTAVFTAGVQELTVSVDGSTSTDTDGSVASYAWAFGDGGTATGATASHVYTAAGTYQVTLTVTDDKGLTNSSTQPVTVTAPPPNQAPTAVFDITAAGLSATVDGSASADADGSIQSYAWDFGDGGTATEAATVHEYTAGGTYQVSLTVTDDDGAETSLTKSVTVTAPPPANVLPTAAFTSTGTGLTTNLDGSTSTDTDGTIATYTWDFGDETGDTGAAVAHEYLAAGTYQVTLTVTDNEGGTDSITQPVTVTAPVVPDAYATDLFSRTVTNGFGSAELGGTYTLNGSPSLFSVNGGVGKIRIASAGAGPLVWLNTVAATDVRGSIDFSYDKAATGGGTYTSVAVRRIGTSDYRFKVRIQPTSVTVQISKIINGVETSLRTQVISGLTAGAGETLRLSFQAQGTDSTALSAKVWKVGAAEPAAWQTTVNDSDATLQGPGAVGIQTYLAGSATNAPVVASLDNLTIGTIPTP
jgi:PKD repeat protein